MRLKSHQNYCIRRLANGIVVKPGQASQVAAPVQILAYYKRLYEGWIIYFAYTVR